MKGPSQCKHTIDAFHFHFSADDLASDLLLKRFPVQSIHGDR